MKTFLQFTLMIFAFHVMHAQSGTGSIVIDSIYSEHLVNDFVENPTRKVGVYLPPNY